MIRKQKHYILVVQHPHSYKTIFLLSSNTLLYIKFLVLWAIVITCDYMLEFRFEFLWPFWLLLRSVHDSFKYKGLVNILHFYTSIKRFDCHISCRHFPWCLFALPLRQTLSVYFLYQFIGCSLQQVHTFGCSMAGWV